MDKEEELIFDKTIQITGFENLEKEEKYAVNDIIKTYYKKIKRLLKNNFELIIKIKEYKKQTKSDKENNKNKKIKFSIQVQVRTSMNKLDSNAYDWDLNKTLHAVFRKIINEIEHRFHVSEQGRE